MRPHVALGTLLWRPRNPAQAATSGKRATARLRQQLKPAPRSALGQDAGQLIADALGRNLVDLGRLAADTETSSEKFSRAANRTARSNRSLSSA